MTTSVFLNDNPISLPESDMTVGRFVQWHNMPTKAMAIAVNNKIVPRKSWPYHILKEGDRITVVNAAFGG